RYVAAIGESPKLSQNGDQPPSPSGPRRMTGTTQSAPAAPVPMMLRFSGEGIPPKSPTTRSAHRHNPASWAALRRTNSCEKKFPDVFTMFLIARAIASAWAPLPVAQESFTQAPSLSGERTSMNQRPGKIPERSRLKKSPRSRDFPAFGGPDSRRSVVMSDHHLHRLAIAVHRDDVPDSDLTRVRRNHNSPAQSGVEGGNPRTRMEKVHQRAVGPHRQAAREDAAFRTTSRGHLLDSLHNLCQLLRRDNTRGKHNINNDHLHSLLKWV